MYVQTSSRVIPLKTTDIIYAALSLSAFSTANKNALTGAQQTTPVSHLACGREDATSTTQGTTLQWHINLAAKDMNLPKSSNTVKWIVAQVCQASKPPLVPTCSPSCTLFCRYSLLLHSLSSCTFSFPSTVYSQSFTPILPFLRPANHLHTVIYHAVSTCNVPHHLSLHSEVQ